MNTFRFIDFPVYVKAKELYSDILKITDNLKDYSLKDQSRRAALSIVLNVAEGAAKESDKEFARYLQNSLGSANELFACLDIMKDNNFIGNEKFEELKLASEHVAKQLGGFFKKLKE
jgi:four helix bundle protein